MKKQISVSIRFVVKYQWAFLIAFAIFVGAIMAYAFYGKGPGQLGDPATFLSFANNISHGEVIYKDFIHFRTPGQYFLESIFVVLFGTSLQTIVLSQAVEWFIIAPVTVLVGLAILLKNKKAYVGLIMLVFMLAIPGLQLRVALAILATILFMCFLGRGKNRNRFLVASGLFTGIDFIFGQDTAVLVVATVFIMLAYQIITHQTAWKKVIKTLGKFCVAAILGCSLLLIYVVFSGAIGTFLYYTLFYAFFIQPGGMDLPYPGISIPDAVFYVPLIIYTIIYASLFLLTKKDRQSNQAVIAFFVFSLLRLMSAAGRSDLGHMFFSIVPDIFIVTFLILQIINKEKARVNRANLVKLIVPLFIFIVLLCGAISIKNLLLFVLAAFVAGTFAFLNIAKTKKTQNNKYLLVLIAVFSCLLVWLILPSMVSTAKDVKHGLFDKSATARAIEATDLVKQTDDIAAIVKGLKPNYIFSFPIHAYYYTLGYEHATPYMTFEPQTTDQEQTNAIDYLKRNKPEVIVFDPLQAEALSKATWKITDYIISNYEIKYVSQKAEIIWIMIPKSKPTETIFPTLTHGQLYDGNSVSGIENPEVGIVHGLSQQPGSQAELTLNRDKNYKEVDVGVFQESPKQICGQIELFYTDGSSFSNRVCGIGNIMMKSEEPISKVKLINDTNEEIIWNNFTISE